MMWRETKRRKNERCSRNNYNDIEKRNEEVERLEHVLYEERKKKDKKKDVKVKPVTKAREEKNENKNYVILFVTPVRGSNSRLSIFSVTIQISCRTTYRCATPLLHVYFLV